MISINFIVFGDSAGCDLMAEIQTSRKQPANEIIAMQCLSMNKCLMNTTIWNLKQYNPDEVAIPKKKLYNLADLRWD